MYKRIIYKCYLLKQYNVFSSKWMQTLVLLIISATLNKVFELLVHQFFSFLKINERYCENIIDNSDVGLSPISI